MAKKFRDLVAKTMSSEARRRAHELAQRELAEMELVELREALKVSQSELARKLRVTQVAVSRLERRPNVLLETLSNYIGALGGELELRAVLPNRTVKLTHLFAASEDQPKPRTKANFATPRLLAAIAFRKKDGRRKKRSGALAGIAR